MAMAVTVTQEKTVQMTTMMSQKIIQNLKVERTRSLTNPTTGKRLIVSKQSLRSVSEF